MAFLTAEDVHVRLDGRPVLHGLSFALDAGQWVGLLGPNGSGKTTLLRAVAGLLPYSGRLLLDGKPVDRWKAADRARRLAFVRQTLSLTFDFSVEEMVLLGRSPHKRLLDAYTQTDRVQVQAALQQVDLDGFERRSVLALSGGERQRVLLAQALVQEADILLLDEPTNHLDVHHQFGFLEEVRRLVGHGGTVIGAFHDLELAARYADHLLVLQDGQLVAAGPPAEVLTADLIATVFRMQARLETDLDGTLRIRYLTPA